MSVWTKVRDAVEAFFSGPVWSFIKPTIDIIESEGGQILISAAEAAVAAGFSAGGGAAGMVAALASFEAAVVTKGLPFIESQARLLIEAALQKAKAKAALPAVPVPAPVAA